VCVRERGREGVSERASELQSTREGGRREREREREKEGGRACARERERETEGQERG